jgi:homoserine O-acetyltransferase/O-succinyltransferase
MPSLPFSCFESRRVVIGRVPRRLAAAVAAGTIVLAVVQAQAVDIRVMMSGAFTAAFTELAPEFERQTGSRIQTIFGGSMGSAPDAIPNRLERGERADVVILASTALDDLIARGTVVRGSRVDLVRSTIGMAVRAGAPKPDISSVDALKQALLRARSIAYSSSASGVYLSTELFPRLGIAEAIASKARKVESGPVGEAVARGEAEIGFQQISELRPVKGIDIVGPLPEGAQRVTIFSAGITAAAARPDAARRLIAFLTSPAAVPAIRKSGLEPAAAPAATSAGSQTASPARNAAAGDGVVQNFALGRFAFESGASIDNAHVTYVTWGTLNAAGDNAVLLPSWYGGRALSYQFLVGPDRSLDPAKYFIVATEMFGSGGSSSPSNTPAPNDGPRFPKVAIRDDVEASRKVLAGLGVKRLRAVIGFSMGAQQAFQWAASHPADVDAIVALCGTAKTYGHGRVRLESAISALTADPRWKGGDYTELPADGVKAWAQHWTAWVYSQPWWRQELYKPQSESPEQVLANSVRSWSSRNLNDAVQLARTWQQHDISRTNGFDGNIEHALAAIRIPVLYMPGATDLYFPQTDAEYERTFLPNVKFVPIPSLWGHTAGGGGNATDAAFINKEIAAFLR